MSDNLHPIPAQAKKRALINREKFESMYAESVNDAESFWAEQGKRLEWTKPYTTVNYTSLIHPISSKGGNMVNTPSYEHKSCNSGNPPSHTHIVTHPGSYRHRLVALGSGGYFSSHCVRG